MIKHALTVLMAAMLPTAAAADAPATRPVDQVAVKAWLTRAEKEVSAMPADTARKLRLPAPAELAICIYRLDPTADRQALAERLIHAIVEQYSPKKYSAEEVRLARLDAAWSFASVDDLQDARNTLAAAKQPTDAAPTTNPWIKMGAEMSAWLEAETDVRIGDRGAFDRFKLSASDAVIMENRLRNDGLIREADLVRARALELIHADEQRPPQTQPDTGLVTDYRMNAIFDHLHLGDVAGAMQSARTMADHLQPKTDRYDPLPGHAMDAYALIADECLRRGEMQNFREAQDALLGVFFAYPDGSEEYFDSFLRRCAGAGDAAEFSQVADLWKKQIEPLATRNGDRPVFAGETAEIALDYAAIHDRTNYQSAVARAEQVLGDYKTDEDSGPDSAKDKAEAYLKIAAARARAGDAAGVAQDKAASKKAFKLQEYDWRNDNESIVDGFADATLFADALAAADDTEKDPHGYLHQYIAHRQAQAKKFDDAWQTLAPVDPSAGAFAVYDLVVREVQAGQIDAVRAHIDALTSPRERTLCDIAVAATLAGRPYPGWLYVYAPKDY